MVWRGMIWDDTVRYGTVRYGVLWYGMVWYGMIWFCIVWCEFDSWDNITSMLSVVSHFNELYCTVLRCT